MRASETGQYLTGRVALVIRGARGFGGDDRRFLQRVLGQRFLDLRPSPVFNRDHPDGGMLTLKKQDRAHRL